VKPTDSFDAQTCLQTDPMLSQLNPI